MASVRSVPPTRSLIYMHVGFFSTAVPSLSIHPLPVNYNPSNAFNDLAFQYPKPDTISRLGEGERGWDPPLASEKVMAEQEEMT